MAPKPKKEEDLFPWEEEGAKKPPQIKSIPEGTSLKSKVRSKPKIEGQEYLDMYLMLKEKERWERYGESLRRTQRQAGQSWTGMVEEIEKTEKQIKKTLPGAKAEGKEEAKKVRKRVPRKPMKTITLDY